MDCEFRPAIVFKQIDLAACAESSASLANCVHSGDATVRTIDIVCPNCGLGCCSRNYKRTQRFFCIECCHKVSPCDCENVELQLPLVYTAISMGLRRLLKPVCQACQVSGS